MCKISQIKSSFSIISVESLLPFHHFPSLSFSQITGLKSVSPCRCQTWFLLATFYFKLLVHFSLLYDVISCVSEIRTARSVCVNVHSLGGVCWVYCWFRLIINTSNGKTHILAFFKVFNSFIPGQIYSAPFSKLHISLNLEPVWTVLNAAVLVPEMFAEGRWMRQSTVATDMTGIQKRSGKRKIDDW